MLKFIKKKLEVIAMHIVIAFFFACVIVFSFYSIFGVKVEKTIHLINKLAISNNVVENDYKDIKIDKINKKLNVYPNYGDKFGSIEIKKVGIDVVVYHGESLKILKYGLAHHAGSYFPGEGGTIIVAGHNTYGTFYNLPNVKENDIILFKTVYGEYEYRVIRTNVLNATKLDKELKINKDKEVLVLYTCYPVDTPGFKSNRFIVYAELVGDNDEK